MSGKKTETKTSDEKTTAVKPKNKVTAKKTASNSAAGGEKKRTGKPSQKKGAAIRPAERTEPSSKTPQVMRLVEQPLDAVNPTILAGKSSIPRKLRGLEPLSRIIRRESEATYDPDEEPVTYNLTALVIDDHAAEILRRFNACDCDICIEGLSSLAAESVPARFAKLKRSSVERRAPEIEELKEPLRKKVTQQMIRLVMQNKKRSYHDI